MTGVVVVEIMLAGVKMGRVETTAEEGVKKAGVGVKETEVGVKEDGTGWNWLK